MGLRYLRRSILIAVLGIILAGWSSTLRAEILIVDDGRPAATIVVADEPSEQAQKAAEELQHYLAAISGATLEIVRRANR